MMFRHHRTNRGPRWGAVLIAAALVGGCSVVTDTLAEATPLEDVRDRIEPHARGLADRVRDRVSDEVTERINPPRPNDILPTIELPPLVELRERFPDLADRAPEILDRIPELTAAQQSPPSGQNAVESVEWGDRGEGGLSLAVTPTQWARDAGFSGWEATWAELIAIEPDADTTVMRDQLICHTIGAGHRATWNLEPWRPDVGLVAVIAALCNPN